MVAGELIFPGERHLGLEYSEVPSFRPTTLTPLPRRDPSAPIMGWGAGGSCTPRPPIRQQPTPGSRVVTVIFLGLLLDLLAFTLLLPLLPGLLESRGQAHVSPPPCPDAFDPHGGCPLPLSLSGPPATFVMLPCRTGPPLWLMATRGGLVRCSHWDASGEEVQQCPVRRYGPEPHAGGL